jgi:hypothetical protein
MARQSGPYKITGTIDNLCFYEMEGKFYARKKSSLTGKRVKKDPLFANTMRYAKLFSTASVIASAVYKKMPAEQKVKGLYRKLTGQAMQLLKAGNTESFVSRSLEDFYLPKPAEKKRIVSNSVERLVFAETLLQDIFSETLPIYDLYAIVRSSSPP